MVGVSYHELTATTPKSARHSAGQRKQFLLICVVGVAVCANAFINAGLLENVVIHDDGIYPGGEYVYKLMEDRDYATTGGIWRRISSDLQEPKGNTLNLNNDAESEDIKYDDSLYSVYIDNLSGGYGRFFNGILIDNSQKDLKERLLEKNVVARTLKKSKDDSAEERFNQIEYQVGDLPSVRAAVARFPFTDGFVSALLHNYKVFPALEKYAQEHLDSNSKIIVSTSCNRELKMCHHYIPMMDSQKFLLNEPDTDEYMKSKPKVDALDIGLMMKGVKKMFGF